LIPLERYSGSSPLNGVEEWLPAFEEAGFKDALLVKEVDSLSEWDAHSLHTSIIYWGASPLLRGYETSGFGGTVSNIIDERTGEILKGDVYMSTSREAYSEMYFVRAAPLDKRAQKFPFPDDLMGELYQCMVAHEVGHVFGLMDAHYGEFAYPFEKMNDVEWLETMGHTPSVMNYTRQNNIAQPEDSIPPSLLNQKVGPMDRYQIRWAYTEFSSDTTAEEVDTALEQIIRLQDSVPWYHYNHDYEGIGPATNDEVVDSREPIRSTEMAFKNLERVMVLLPKACNDQKDNTRLERLYVDVLDLWYRQLRQVAYLLGGYDIQLKSIEQPGNRYLPITRPIQKEALDFLIQNVLYPPKWLEAPPFDSRINYTVNRDQLLERQLKLMLDLLQSPRLKRLEYMDKMDGFEGIVQDYLTSLQYGLFQELYEESDHLSPRNREIQLFYIDMLIRILDKERINITVDEKMYDYTDYSKGLLIQQLIRLEKDIVSVLKKKKVKGLVGHWRLCLSRLRNIL